MKKAIVCYNPNSGSQKLSKFHDYINEKLKNEYEVSFYTTKKERDLVSFLRDKGTFYDLAIISGGDGTLSEASEALAGLEKKPVLLYIPGGTCNDVGRMLKISKSVKKSIELVKKGKVVEMDVCKANDRNFVYAFGSGKFVDVSYNTSSRLKRRYGKLAYFFSGLKQLPDRRKLHAKINVNGITFEGDYYVILGLNSNRVAGFTIHKKNKVKLNDGLFDLTLIESRKPICFPRLVRFMLFGDFGLKKGIRTFSTENALIELDDNTISTIDGENGTHDTKVELKVVPKAIKILVSYKIANKLFI